MNWASNAAAPPRGPNPEGARMEPISSSNITIEEATAATETHSFQMYPIGISQNTVQKCWNGFWIGQGIAVIGSITWWIAVLQMLSGGGR